MSKSLYINLQEAATSQRLVQIARTHCKLVLEHGQANTSPQRRTLIQAEIEALRIQRTELLEGIAHEAH